MNKRILLVDDDTHFRNITLSALSERGHDIIQAANYAEATNELRTGNYDLLIIDGQLPDGDGISLIEEIRATGVQSAIIFVSAYWRDTETYHRLTKLLKVNVVLHKPIIPSAFVEHVDHLLGFGQIGQIAVAAKASAREKLAKLSDSYGKKLPEAINEISSAIIQGRTLLSGSDYIVDSSRKAHMLRGTAASYGFPEVSTAMGKVEDRLRQFIENTLNISEEQAWEEIRAALSMAQEYAKEALSRASKLDVYTDEPGAAQILAITSDSAITAQMTTFARTKDINLSVCDAETASKKCKISRFDAIFCQIEAKTADETFKFLEEIRKLEPNMTTPIILIAERLESAYEAQGLFVGSAATLLRPLDLNQVNIAYGKVMEERRRNNPRVVLIDDDVNFIKRAELLLNAEDQQVQSFDDTAKVLDVLGELNPDVLFLDVDIAGVSGFDICRKMREYERWRTLPVIFVTAHLGWETRRAAFECGGDDYLAKPIVNAELTLKSKIWLERGRTRRHHQQLDALTGLPLNSTFAISAQQMLTACQVESKPFTLALVSIENLTDINKESGPAAGDNCIKETARYLKAHFPPHCLRGRWNGNQFAMALPGVSADDARAVMQLFAHPDNAPTRIDFAIASSGGDKQSLFDLTAQAESALRQRRAEEKRLCRCGKLQSSSDASFGSCISGQR